MVRPWSGQGQGNIMANICPGGCVFVGQTCALAHSLRGNAATPPSLTAIPMSTHNQTPNAPTSNFTPIFQTACDEYKRITGHDLATHPFATELDHCNSPDGILHVLGKQSQAFTRSRRRNEKLLAWLSPIVYVLFTFSATLGEGIGLVSISPLCVIN